jgi:hypothetical protein
LVLRFIDFGLFICMWRACEALNFTRPDAVTRKRFFAPLLVFIFGISISCCWDFSFQSLGPKSVVIQGTTRHADASYPGVRAHIYAQPPEKSSFKYGKAAPESLSARPF